MWEFTKIFSSSDNLFKFLFVGGISMLFIAMFYPLSKQHELQLLKNKFDLDKSLLEHKVKYTENALSKLVELKKESDLKLEELGVSITKSKSDEEKEIFKKRYNIVSDNYKVKYSEVNAMTNEIEISNIELINAGEKLIIIDNQINSYSFYTCLFQISGILTSLIGFTGWLVITIRTESIRLQQIEKNRHELIQSGITAPKSLFQWFREYCNKQSDDKDVDKPK